VLYLACKEARPQQENDQRITLSPDPGKETVAKLLDCCLPNQRSSMAAFCLADFGKAVDHQVAGRRPV
jgi:hypothetical protein